MKNTTETMRKAGEGLAKYVHDNFPPDVICGVVLVRISDDPRENDEGVEMAVFGNVPDQGDLLNIFESAIESMKEEKPGPMPVAFDFSQDTAEGPKS